MDLQFRDLRPEEIEVRVGSVIKDKDTNEPKSFQLLLYKTARVDANVLDDALGVFGWQKRFYQVKNTMVCSIGLYNKERNEWIWKDDGGDDDFTTEQVKAELSDSFKRAGFAIGIGRKLYSASKIYMVVDITKNNTPKSYYQVKEIAYDDTSITKLLIINKKTKEEVIKYGYGYEKPSSTPTPTSDAISEDNLKFLQSHILGLHGEEYNNFFKALRKRYNTSSIAELTNDQAIELLGLLRKGKENA